jgi:hypothetical protein
MGRRMHFPKICIPLRFMGEKLKKGSGSKIHFSYDQQKQTFLATIMGQEDDRCFICHFPIIPFSQSPHDLEP